MTKLFDGETVQPGLGWHDSMHYLEILEILEMAEAYDWRLAESLKPRSQSDSKTSESPASIQVADGWWAYEWPTSDNSPFGLGQEPRR